MLTWILVLAPWVALLSLILHDATKDEPAGVSVALEVTAEPRDFADRPTIARRPAAEEETVAQGRPSFNYYPRARTDDRASRSEDRA